jgi:hypothetical protein
MNLPEFRRKYLHIQSYQLKLKAPHEWNMSRDRGKLEKD